MPGLTIRVAFQGELGAYSEQALRQYWLDAERNGAIIEPVPARRSADVVRLMERGAAEYGLLAIENSLAGSVIASYDALAGSHDVHVVGEIILPIHHCVLAPRGATLAGVRTVESHPVALAQCGGFFERHPHLAPRAAYDTAGAAQDVAERQDLTRAAIAGRTAADRFDLAILAADVEDRADNQTRFLALAREPVTIRDGAPAKTTLLVTTPNVPGALHRLLAPFAAAGLNLSKLESHTSGEPWSYRFFIEVEHTLDRAALDALLRDAARGSASIRELGTFPPCPTNATPAAAPSAGPAGPAPEFAYRPTRRLHALRGATTVDRDTADRILDATRELLAELMRRNGISAGDVISAIFTTTPDLVSEYPTAAARALGWDGVPLMCMSEIAVATGLPRCVRVLIHADADRHAQRPRHVYLRGATVLRPDLVTGA